MDVDKCPLATSLEHRATLYGKSGGKKEAEAASEHMIRNEHD
jgi:hypothetical protein